MKLIRKYMSGQKGFTLIELLVVVAILGILATIAVPRVMDAIDNARTRKAEADLTVLRDALERWYLDYGIFPPSLSWLNDVNYQYVDPNFSFKNSYGKIYFYAVLYNGATNPASLTDYVLADPGKVPADTAEIWMTAPTAPNKVCEGTDPKATATKGHAYYWGTATNLELDVAAPPPYLCSWMGVVSGKTFNLAGDGDDGVADMVQYTIYSDEGTTEILPAGTEHGKIASPPAVYTGK